MKTAVLLLTSLFSMAALAANPQGSRGGPGSASAPIRLALNDTPIDIDIKAQKLATALLDFSRQAGVQVLTATEAVDNIDAPAIQGRMAPAQAIAKLLANTNLKYHPIGSNAIAIENNKTAFNMGEWFLRLAQNETPSPEAGKDKGEVEKETGTEGSTTEADRDNEQASEKGISEILVKGTRVLNTDSERTRDDIQPYVVFDKEAIQKSGVRDINSFLKQRLPMNTAALSNDQGASTLGNMSEINLRGLGANQTLILIDGHRAAPGVAFGSPVQPDINGIPLSAVERIEILPTTASGIYGGGATGGVVNVVLRRDYSGSNVKLTYDNSFESNSALKRIDGATGFTSKSGNTQLLLAASFSDQNPLRFGDRDFAEDGRQQVLENNPAYYLSAFSPVLGAQGNVRSSNGSPLFGPGTSNVTHLPSGYMSSQGLAPLQANAGSYDLGLANTAQNTIGSADRSLLNPTTTKSVMATVRTDVTSHLKMFLDGSYSRQDGDYWTSGLANGLYSLSATAPNNPFGQRVFVNVPIGALDANLSPESENLRFVGGAIVSLPHDWSAGFDHTWASWKSQVTPPPAFASTLSTAFFNGNIDILRDWNSSPLDLSNYILHPKRGPSKSESNDSNLRLAGPVFSMPAGPVTLSSLLEYRRENFEQQTSTSATGAVSVFPQRSQNVSSAYLEANIPLISAAMQIPGAQDLRAQLAIRHDRYEVNGSTDTIVNGAGSAERVTDRMDSTNPTFGLRYQPIRDLALRASYGRGFLPPGVDQLSPAEPFDLFGGDYGNDARRNEPLGNLTLTSEGNRDLRPETSKSWSAGLIVTPRWIQGFRLSLDYTRIEKTDNIGGYPGDIVAILSDLATFEAAFPSRVTRGANLPGDAAGEPGPVIAVDVALLNIARAKVEAFDLQLDQHIEFARYGSMDVYAIGTRQTHYQTQLQAGSPTVENVGISYSNPLKLKANAGITWTYRDLGITWNTRYFDSYKVSADPTVILNQGNGGKIPSQWYHDLAATYRLGAAPMDLLSGVQLQLGVKNIFNKKPPFDANAGFADGYYSPYGDARLASYFFSVSKDL